jgi:hypothetical protein
LFFNLFLFFRRSSKSTFSAGLCRRSKLPRQIAPALLSIFLLPSAFSSQALTPQTTRNAINGSAPYLTFDGGLTRATNVDELLAITLPDGTRITPSTNTSSASNPIQLQRDNVSSIDIGMAVPTNASSVALNTLIGPPNNYWRDDDGDGQGSGGITATGTLTLSIVGRNGLPVTRGEVFTTACGNKKAPYKLTLSFTGGELRTRYGFPSSRNFSPSRVAYYINPKAGSAGVCFARPNLSLGSSSENSKYRGPSNIWNSDKGFLTQSTDPAHYDKNFPTTGSNNLYFYLDIDGVDPSTLSWPSVTHSGITASMAVFPPNPSVGYNRAFERLGGIRVTLTGPAASSAQMDSRSPGNIPRPTLPATFELVGRDSSGRAVIKYGFKLKQWFVSRDTNGEIYSNSSSWCNSIGYQMPKLRDLTNGVRTVSPIISGATPPSSGDYYQRRIGAGFFTEWGDVGGYLRARFAHGAYWTSDAVGNNHFYVSSDFGIFDADCKEEGGGECTSSAVCASSLRP